MFLRYRDYANQKYIADGRPGKEYVEMKYAARPVRELFGSMSVRRFGPKDLKLVQQHIPSGDFDLTIDLDTPAVAEAPVLQSHSR